MDMDIAVGWIGAISAGGGAAIGGAVTLLANIQTNRAAKKQREQEREHAVTDRQFNSQVAFLDAANELTEKIRQHWGSLLDDDADDATIKATKEKYIEAWRVYFTSTSAARLAGPGGLEPAASSFREAMRDYSKCLDGWDAEHAEPTRSKTNEEWHNELNSLSKQLTEKKDAYIAEGVDLLSS